MMFALALDVPPVSLWSTPVVAYRHESSDTPAPLLPVVYSGVRYEAGSALTTGSLLPSSGEDWMACYQPKTDLGRRLLELRQAYVSGGGTLVSERSLEAEVRQRRGGVTDA